MNIQIDWKPDKSSQIPVYKQIVEYISQKIGQGEWPIGTRLPSQRAMAEQFEVNRSTITSAIEELTSYSIIAGKHGAGTQVISNTWSLMLPVTQDWNRFISNGFFEANNRVVQTINNMEFAPDILRLGTGELDHHLFDKKQWKKVLQSVGSKIDSLGYLEPLGLLELRQALSKHLQRQGMDVSPNQILITSGALQALQLISSSLLQQGTTVFTEEQSYLKSLQMFQSTGMYLSGVPMDDEGLQYWKIPVKKRENSILYTIPTNQNPTGITMSEKRRHDLLDFCDKNGLPVIEDGAYQELIYDQETPMPLQAIDDNGMVIYLGSASKTLAPGLRLGWLIAPEPIVQRLGDVKMQMDYGASSLSQWALTEFLNSGAYDENLASLKEELKSRRDNALRVLDEHFKDIATWKKPAGGFYIWLTFNDKINVEKLFKVAVKKHVLLNPGDIYGFKQNRSLRISFAYLNKTQFELAIGILSGIVRGKSWKK
ncbi:aminotransferase-like domain-containing protein [Companilactobacillus sp.]|jgi:GntR family transcriptional regulator of abcA and norABC|uniref:aminotransferase-like domain-containing protein n=1 Tax=Companilactobacillus sp. TaxID=2767905 RepID=UPI0025BB7CCE|nr:PLP-dependent aminotransferase family protein [Companilactobacillus sp.]MCH4009751.1 PLP-dependent aminotransferase family protein [Companilactobacillus sp.]MCH4052573.1 PLP-dependent aminotransferase family protein [Companilactobacillus sp.]MCH4077693.1 PLP-dependent aminotransferase family protein [Companilactobacillus sp.]MCH4126269.1 PLP-dependent aminotransferase family protein [Companilactobacillus sp.]MCI1311977.1 PLP-dependent aminotransferase family protein [Companilactobacillus sp